MIALNGSQQRSISINFLDMHRRMSEMEAFIAQSKIQSALSEYINDLSPTEARVVQDYFARIRTAMLGSLTGSGIPIGVRHTSLRWILQCNLNFLHVAVAEMSPGRLRGYGPVDNGAAAEVLKIQQDLRRLIDRVAAYLRQGAGQNLHERLARLERQPVHAGLLTLMERIIDRWQLVEFRPMLETIIRRLEAPEFEIAVFGRVSSGKSSLLNHILGTDVLPVGVTPITAVPTRLTRGEPAVAVVSFAEVQARRVDVHELRAYASEEGNPGNEKHVTGIVVQLPSPRLREGVILVDTPGIGSLALSGSSETFAYLPRCDLGVVLIDAGSALNQEDASLLRVLYEAAIPALVLLSKADLLSPGDRQRLVGYIHDKLKQELGLELPVHPVSTVGSAGALLSDWFEHEIGPLFDRQRELVEASLQRKIGHLRESLIAVLQTLLARQGGGEANGQPSGNLASARRLLEQADSAIQHAKDQAQQWTADRRVLIEIILEEAAEALVAEREGSSRAGTEGVAQVAQRVLVERGRTAFTHVMELRETLSNVLATLQQTARLARADPSTIRSAVLAALPAAEVSSQQVNCRSRRPWYASVLPRLAKSAVRRALHKEAGPSLEGLVDNYDRQLRAWIKTNSAQLVELYEAQAEVFREQVRRLTVCEGSGENAKRACDLATDLQELEVKLPLIKDGPEARRFP